MSIPKLKKIQNVKKYHGIELIDEYSWVDQSNILDVLKDGNKILPEVKEYIDKNNNLCSDFFSNIKNFQDELFKEIKGKIKLDDTSLKFKDKRYFYWTKTDVNSNYSKKIRQLIDKSKDPEVYFDGDVEKKKYGSKYFGVGAISVSHCDKILAYSLDLQGSEYYTIYLRNLENKKKI